MNSVQIIARTLLFLFHLCQAQVGCQGKTGLFVADPNNQPSAVYLQCISGQLFHFASDMLQKANKLKFKASIVITDL